MSKRTWAVIAITLACCQHVEAASYDYHSSAPIKLGGVWNRLDPTNDLQKECFIVTERAREVGIYGSNDSGQDNIEFVQANSSSSPSLIDDIDALGAPTFELSPQTITTRDQLYRALNVSAELSARFGIKKADFSSEYSSEFATDDRSVSYALTSSATFFDEVIDFEVELTRAGKRTLRRSRSGEEFLSTCGTDIISRLTRGANITAVYHFRARSTKDIETLKAYGSASFTNFRGSVDIESLTSRLAEESEFKFDLEARGNPDLYAGLTELIRADYQNLDFVRETISEFMLRSIEQRKEFPGTIIRFATTEVSSLEFFKREFPEFQFIGEGQISRKLNDFASQLERIALYQKTLTDIERSFNYDDYQANALETIYLHRQQYDKAYNEIFEAAEKCAGSFDVSDCAYTPGFIRPLRLAEYLNTFIKFQAWNFRGELILTPNLYNRSGVGYADLYVRVPNPSLLRSVKFIRNGEVVSVFTAAQILEASSGTSPLEGVLQYTTPSKWGYKENPEEFNDRKPLAIEGVKALVAQAEDELVALVELSDGDEVHMRLISEGG